MKTSTTMENSVSYAATLKDAPMALTPEKIDEIAKNTADKIYTIFDQHSKGCLSWPRENVVELIQSTMTEALSMAGTWEHGMTDAVEIVKYRNDGTLGRSSSRQDIIDRIITARDEGRKEKV